MVPLTWQLAAIQGMRADQIVARVRLRTSRALGAAFPGLRPGAVLRRRASRDVLLPAEIPSGVSLGLRPLDEAGASGVLDEVRARADLVAAGRFRFLNEERDWTLPVDWMAMGASRLWRFHLHYFEDAPALALAGAATGDGRYPALFSALAADWIDQNRVGLGDGWHPYTLSRRIPNWIYVLELANPRLSRSENAAVTGSLWEQTQYLARNLEFDALGNHLLSNARALLFAGAFFAGRPDHSSGGASERWWQTGRRILEHQLPEQFLADGGHFERSPMYHALVLQDLLECAALLRHRGDSLAALEPTIHRAQNWLDEMCHPDGGVALFNDSTLEAPAHAELAAFAAALCDRDGDRLPSGRWTDQTVGPGWRQSVWRGRARLSPGVGWGVGGAASRRLAPIALVALPESGYFVLRDPEALHALLFDAGEPCPSYIPAHAHADLLSYELSLFGRRVIVDSGVCEYEAGPWRDYCRSTRGHNTIQVDGQDQSEVWSSFRLGRRARPLEVEWGTDGACAFVRAGHTGYRRLRGGVVHRRSVTFDRERFRIQDEVTGGGVHRVESFLHFHPDFNVHLEAGGLMAEGQGIRLSIRFSGEVRADLRRGDGDSNTTLQGWYCPEFGVRQPNPTVVLSREGRLPARIGYEIAPLSGDAR